MKLPEAPKTWWMYVTTIVAVLAPHFMLARSITDGDEAVKSTVGLATVAAVVTVAKLFHGKEGVKESN